MWGRVLPSNIVKNARCLWRCLGGESALLVCCPFFVTGGRETGHSIFQVASVREGCGLIDLPLRALVPGAHSFTVRVL